MNYFYLINYLSKYNLLDLNKQTYLIISSTKALDPDFGNHYILRFRPFRTRVREWNLVRFVIQVSNKIDISQMTTQLGIFN